MSSPLVGLPVVKTQAISCPNCGGPVELRGFGHALTAVCQQCLSILDMSTPEVKILGQIQEKQRKPMLIPLGTRGKFSNVAWEVIGFQTRSVEDDSWDEYLLFNPYKGFRYVTEYQGHWNFVTPLNPMPERSKASGRPAVSIDGKTFKHFSGANATTSFVLGEFPWRVKVGERVVADDYVNPPSILSSETTPDEVTWSRGEYTAGSEIWKAFALPGKPPSPQGIYLNQPSAHPKGGPWGSFFLMLLVLIGLAIFFATFSRENIVFQNHYTFSTLTQKGDPAYVTPVFNVDGRTSGLELSVHTDLANNWAYFDFALIDDDTGTAYDFGREVSYYYGSDSDGAWSEGGATSTAYIASVPPGHYYLRVEPEMDAAEGKVRVRTQAGAPPAKVNTMNYDITLRHEVPNYSWFWIAALALLIPPIFLSIRSRSFEVKRWMQSDYPPITRG